MTLLSNSVIPSWVRRVFGMPEGEDARDIARRAQALMPEDGVHVHVAMDDAHMARLGEQAAFFAPAVKIISFPAWDCLPYDRVSPSGEIVSKRLEALALLQEWQSDKKRYPRLLLTTVNAVTQRVMPRKTLQNAAFIARKGGKISQAALESFLSSNGYARTDTVREAGEFAFRGGIVDLFPSGHEQPVRLDLFGEDIESIRLFDPDTQRSGEMIEQVSLRPATEFFLSRESVERFRGAYRYLFGVPRSDDPLYEAISAGRKYNGVEHWLPLFHEGMETIFEYVGPYFSISFDHHGFEAQRERAAQVRDFWQTRKTMEEGAKGKTLSGAAYKPIPPDSLYVPEGEWAALLQQRDAAVFVPFAAPDDDQKTARRGRDFGDIRALPDGDLFGTLKTHIAAQILARKKIMVAAYSAGSRDRLRGLMEAVEIGPFQECADGDALRRLAYGTIGLAVLDLEHGFEADDITVLTEQDILGDRMIRRTRKKSKKADNFLREVSSLSAGDLVVHADHGIGRFEGLETLRAGGTLHDCLLIVYHGGDKLFVPVENIEILSRFGSEEGLSQLDKLGGAAWQARKAKVKKDLMRIAHHLLGIAAERELRKSDKLGVPSGFYDEFAARFPYQETEDQLRAIHDVILDLEAEKPMDRLVCGDVGFGKTEVALRAAFVAAMSGSQVAVVVPTTLLARQHYQNFMARFQGMGIRVEQLSRMVTPKEADQVRKGLKDGTTHIVVGTHAILGKEVGFSNLGLVIVDEEQRFGVKQKEKLKELKANVHVLTLTATPIPRTLQMALTGVRDMSLITTPPVDRLAIRTFVLPFDPLVVREAILREHYRGGQSFYVCPRISDLTELEEKLRELVPEVKVIAAHGQMTPTELEDRMTAFCDGVYDVLLATNIIESGIDIPKANTMIVHRADMFGLAQLYQIRGRIGRSKVRAYAYLTYAPDKKLSAQSQKRLEVIETLDTLGSGFQLASHDMDIRGAGNLLGEEQSGHVREVGVELYQQMLEEAVASARQGGGVDIVAADHWSPQINLGTSVLIPEDYVTDLNVRMSLYRRLADLEDQADIEGFAAEMIDRFGPVPDEVTNLLDIVSIKQLCRTAGVDRIDAGPKGAVVSFWQNRPPKPESLLRWLAEYRGGVKLRPDQKLSMTGIMEKAPDRVKAVRNLMKKLAQLAA
jgi:transcription-repair coupling factor (superfamily II helicase)